MYFLAPITGIINGNSLFRPANSSEVDYSGEAFIFEDENAETVGAAQFNCSSPEECLNVSLSMVDNSELMEIYDADYIPDYQNNRYYCRLKCNYQSGEVAYLIFTDEDIVLYYQDELVKGRFDNWFEDVAMHVA
ncbi:hypothetical protein [Methanochimaera problematica]|nr:hypothetical protein [Methanoplanus sp. FWC-SCC4]